MSKSNNGYLHSNVEYSKFFTTIPEDGTLPLLMYAGPPRAVLKLYAKHVGTRGRQLGFPPLVQRTTVTTPIPVAPTSGRNSGVEPVTSWKQRIYKATTIHR